MKDSRAVEPLLAAINKQENKHYNGTWVYALETLDCRQKLKEVFDILFYGDYEAKISADNLLDKQVFEFTEKDLLSIQVKWQDYKRHPEQCPELEYWQARIEDSVEGFMAYLKEE